MNAPEHILPPDRGRRAPVNLMSDSQQDALRDAIMAATRKAASKERDANRSAAMLRSNEARRAQSLAAALGALGDAGMSARDVRDALGMKRGSHTDLRRRLEDLVERGFARVCGDRASDGKRRDWLFQITPEGRAWLAAQGGGE